MPQFCYDSILRGYHVYKDVWEVSLSELLKSSLGGLIFMMSIPRKRRKFIHLKNLYVYSISMFSVSHRKSCSFLHYPLLSNHVNFDALLI